MDLEWNREGEKSDADLAESVPQQRRPDAVREPSELPRADAEGEQERGDHGGRGERGVPPDVGKPLEPDDFVGKPRATREEKEDRGHPVRAPQTISVCRHSLRVA